MARLYLTRRALLDVDEVDRYSVERWGDKVAGRYLNDIQAGLQRLSDSPSLLREQPEYSLRLRFYRVREHLLVCDVVGETVFVLALRHGSMDLPRRIAELEPQLVDEAELLHARIVKRGAGPMDR